MVPVGIFLEVLSTNKSLVLTKFGQDDNLDLVRSGVLNLDLNLVFSTSTRVHTYGTGLLCIFWYFLLLYFTNCTFHPNLYVF